MAKRYEADVPQDVIHPDPEDESPDRMITVAFEWTAGQEPSGMSGPPENYDPGSADEFYILEEMDESAQDRVIEWLDEHWERPEDGPDPDDLRQQRIDDELTGGA